MNTPDKVIAIAQAEVGYLEKSKAAYQADPNVLYDKTAGAGSDNYTKYGKEMHDVYPQTMDFPAFWCFTQDTMVFTDNGYKSIDQLEIGDKVLNASGNKFNTVMAIATRKKSILDFRAYGSLNFGVTKDHPILGNQRLGVRKDWKHTELNYYNAGDYKKGDNVIIPFTGISQDINLSYDEAWVIGYYVGDGWREKKGGRYRLCGNDLKEKELLKHLHSYKKDKDYKSRTCHEYTITENPNDDFWRCLNEAGTGAENKQVPVSILLSNMAIKTAFLDGYLCADGYKNFKFSTISKKLALGISKISFDVGYGCALRECIRKENQVIFDTRYNDYRKIKIHPIIYVGQINRSSDKAHRSDRRVDNLIYVPVKSNDDYGREELVYNITTNGDHTFTANNIAVHNCDCFVDWCFYKAYGVTTAQNIICGNFDDYTVNSAQMYKNKGAWYSIPEVGDQIFFKNDTRICHTGLVEKVADGRVYTIEGNTSDKNLLEPNGGCVARKSYPLNYPKIAGYGRPLYDKPESVQSYIQGIDVNEAQGVIDFAQVKDSGIKFVCMRSTRKSGKTDAYFERNLAECIDKQLDYSCFKYAYAKTHEAARIEADGVINLIKDRKMPIWYDLEDSTLVPLGKDGIEGITLAFLGECKDAGYDVGIYCNKTWYDNYISDYLKKKFKFWIARYGKNTGELMEMYKPKGKNIIAWQYTSKGRVPGIIGDVDRDVLY